MTELQTTPYGVWQCCKSCREWLPADEEFFGYARNNAHRLALHCKVCVNTARKPAARQPAPAPARCTDALAGVMGRGFAQGE